ncbi:MAG: sugar ABC transporter permease [Trueperaceae bacterium]|nr:sugar ABC transporter permease [Trueperaceae bacterium]
MRTNDRLVAFLMLLPSLVLLSIFVYGFIGRTAWVSLTNWGADASQALALNPELAFVGFENYRKLFTGLIDVRFRQDLVNTFFFTVFFLLGTLGLGLGLAILLDQKVRFEAVFRTIFLFPFALAFIVTGTVWRWMLQPAGGVNVLPELVGLPALELRWLTTREQIWQFDWNTVPAYLAGTAAAFFAYAAWRAWRDRRRVRAGVHGAVTVGLLGWALSGTPGVTLLPYPEPHGFNVAFVGIVVAAVWQLSGYTMALYLAGLRGVPEDLREAARVDGASEFGVYRHVVLPLLGPITLSAMIILGHISLKIFDLIWAMAGADNATTDVPALLMYLRSFRANRFAEGAAIAMVLLIMVALVIVPYLRSSLKGEVRR